MSQNSTNLNLTLTQVPDDDAVLTGTYINDQSGYASTSNMQKIDAFAGNIENTVTNMQGSGYTNQTLKGLDDAIIQTNQKVTYTTTVTGTNTLAGTITELITIQNNLNIFIIPTVANTGAVTLNINTTGALPLVKIQNWTGSTVYAPLEAGDLTPNTPTLIKKSSDGLRYIYIGIENSASHVYFKKATNDYVNLQTKLEALDSTIYEGVLNERDILCGIPQSVTIANATSVIPKFDLNPRVIINPLGKIGGFYKDSNSDGLADGWTGSNAGTYSLSNGEQTFTPTSNSGNLSNLNTFSIGRVIFACSYIKTTDNTASPSIFAQTQLASKTNSGSGVYEKCGNLRQIVSTSVYVGCASTAKTSSFVPITVKQAFYVDVTDYPELVGLTNQQKLDWCLANLEYCDGIGVTKNPTVKVGGKNLFDVDSLHGDPTISFVTYNNTKCFSYISNATVSTQRWFVNNKFEPNVQYTVKFKGAVSSSSSPVLFWYTDGTYSVANSITGSSLADYTGISTIGKTIYYMSGAFNDGQTVYIDSTSIQLEKGTTATTYEPYRKSITTIQGDFLTGDKISILNNETVGTKLWASKKTLYGKDYTFSGVDFTGFKAFITPIGIDGVDGSQIVQKYDGSILTNIPLSNSITTANQNKYGGSSDILNGGEIVVSVSDADTGFTETLLPNADEIKAFMNGWKATANNGTRYTAWVSVVDGTTTPTVQSIDFVKANIAPNYDGYQLYYKYATPKVIDDNSRDYLAPLVGDDINFDSGVNTVTLINGVIKGELVSPVADATYYYINNNYTPLYGSKMQNKMASITSIYKNGEDDTANWSIPSGSAFDNGVGAKILIGKYDTNATYTVDGVIFNSPQIGSGQLSYKDGIVEVVNDLVGVVNSKQDKSVVLDAIVDKAMYEKISPDFQSSTWAVSEGVLYVQAFIPISEKLTTPVITVKDIKILQGGGLTDVTSKFLLNVVKSRVNDVIIQYSTIDSGVIADIKANGMLISTGLIADCRGRV